MNAEATLQLRFSLRRTFFCVSAVLEIESASHASALSFLISFFFEVLLCFNLCKRIHFIFSVRPTLNITERTFRMTFYMSFHNFYVPEAASKAEANRRGTKSSWHHFSFIESIELRLYNDVWTLETVFSTFLTRCQRHAKWIIFFVGSYDISCFFIILLAVWDVYGCDVGWTETGNWKIILHVTMTPKKEKMISVSRKL